MNTSSCPDPLHDPKLLECLTAAPQLILLLDYDGTLVPYAPTPEKAVPDRELIELLLALTRRPHTEVNIISGRGVATLERWFAAMPVGLFAEHGLWAKPRFEVSWRPLHPISNDWKIYVRPVLEHFTRQTRGARIEYKSGSIAWHYRLVADDIAAVRVPDVYACLDELTRVFPIDVIKGDKVLEVRMRGVNKGLVVTSFGADFSNALILALGDDCTDEDLFKVLPQGSIAVHVGEKPSIAPYRLRDFQEARQLLESILMRSCED